MTTEIDRARGAQTSLDRRGGKPMTPLTLLHFLMSDVFMGYFKRAEFWHRTGCFGASAIKCW